MKTGKKRAKYTSEMQKSIFGMFIRHAFLPVFFVFIILTVAGALVFSMLSRVKTDEAFKDVTANISTFCGDYAADIESLASDKDVSAVLSGGDTVTAYEKFYGITNLQSVKGEFFVLNAEGKFLIESKSNDPYMEQAIVKNVGRYSGGGVQLKQWNINYPYMEMRSLAFVSALKSSRGVEGYIVFMFPEAELSEFISAAGAEAVVITDSFSNVVATSDELLVSRMNKFLPEKHSSGKLTVGNANYICRSGRIEGAQLDVYVLRSTEPPGTLFTLVTLILGLVLLLLAVLLLILARLTARLVAEPLDDLIDTVDASDGTELRALYGGQRSKTFAPLWDRYLYLTARLDGMMEKNRELSEMKRDAELKQLRAQFNPHLLFNTLETLRYMIASDAETAQKLVLQLAELLRYSLYQPEDSATVESDCRYIENYLAINKSRFGKRLEYRIEIEEEARGACVPKLLAQPVIENSVKYGLKKRTEISVVVSVRREGDALCWEITDNGGGLQAAAFESLMRAVKNCDGGKGIGIADTQRRIKLLFGSEYGLSMENSPDNGLRTRLFIPFRESKDV